MQSILWKLVEVVAVSLKGAVVFSVAITDSDKEMPCSKKQCVYAKARTLWHFVKAFIV